MMCKEEKCIFGTSSEMLVEAEILVYEGANFRREGGRENGCADTLHPSNDIDSSSC